MTNKEYTERYTDIVERNTTKLLDQLEVIDLEDSRTKIRELQTVIIKGVINKSISDFFDLLLESKSFLEKREEVSS